MSYNQFNTIQNFGFSMQTWYYWSNNTEFGPVTKLQLFTLYKEKQIAGYNFVRPEGSEEWTSYKDIDIHQSDFTSEELDNNSHFIPMVRNVQVKSSESRLKNNEEEFDNLPLEINYKWKDTSPHPWRRSFARFLDIAIYSKFLYIPGIYFLTSGISPARVEQSSPTELIALLISLYFSFFLFAIFLNTVLISLVGNTLGRWIFGIKTLDKNFSPLGFRSALEREFYVWKNGLAFGIPIINLITQVYGYLDLTMKKKTSWDKKLGTITTQREDNTKQFLLCIVGILGYLIVSNFS
ncbi:MAG: RDD family protein [Halopseudomonas aestusnigri]